MAGTVVAVQMQAAGYNWEIDALCRLVMRDQQRSFESSLLLLPTSISGIWSSSDVVLTTPLRNYSVDDYRQLFDELGYPEGRTKLDEIQTSSAYMYQLLDRDLGVAIYCFYSGGVPTPERLIYDSMSMFPDSEVRKVMGQGDGTVNLRSLEACGRWKHVQQQHPVNVKYYPDMEHNELLDKPQIVRDILRHVG